MANITLRLNDAEQQAFHQLLDISLRNAGMNAYNTVSHFVGLLSNAAQIGAEATVVPHAAVDTAAQSASQARTVSPSSGLAPSTLPLVPAFSTAMPISTT